MQGDIFMLDQISIQIPTPRNMAAATQPKAAKTAPQVAIYNEDDLSHLLYADAIEPASTSHHHHHMASIHDHHHHDCHQPHNHDGTLTPLEAPVSGSHTPVFSDHESAVLDDWESDELEIPRSPSRRRGGTMCSSDDDFEWPIFLGRQSDELDASLLRRPSLFRLDSSPEPHKAEEKRSKRKAVPEEHHVPSIGGPLMALWPSAMEVLEWQERFYE
ncbi:hypothetical protein DL766_005421 [Monosporascus sp. MC13-8B]|uniref:Uncharacterized protein n=1 Tax=Monosporascus cannonballus TaxID=155416 RepID=A0ABY0H078_9PEZI|nr:hypothetical protein DL762_008390 [Monosporascus cannonballus]RYP29364.1 hypothetical protein DL766_005421 [Monosporascus sp. MC13-8B]